MGNINPEVSLERIKTLKQQRDDRLREVEKAINDDLEDLTNKMIGKIKRIEKEIDNLFHWYLDPVERKISGTVAFCAAKEDKIEKEIAKLERYLNLGGGIAPKSQSAGERVDVTDVKLLQAMSYTVFDTILFTITRGSAPDFALISQSALFETVYANISRGFQSYLFQDVPLSAVAVIHQGRSILDDLRSREERFLDEPDLWEIYAPEIQKWWVNTALPVIFGERDPDWDTAVFPTHDEMKTWTEGEFSQRKHFPAVADLIELAKERAVDVSDTFNFKILLAA